MNTHNIHDCTIINIKKKSPKIISNTVMPAALGFYVRDSRKSLK